MGSGKSAEPAAGGSDDPSDSSLEGDFASALDRNYRIIERINEGAGSIVYKAEHKLLGETVAIKVLKQVFLSDPAAIERFKREARLAMKLEHLNIIRLKGFGIKPDGEPYIVMEYLEGDTLEGKLAKAKPSLADTRTIGIQIAGALSYAHRHNIIHRDIKPANILLARLRDSQKPFEAKLLDFGLAKEISPDQSAGESNLTQSNNMLGTPNYMSPEQCGKKIADTRSDIYSLGCVLYECATGRKPFVAQSDLAVMSMHMNDPVSFRKTDRLSPALEEIITKCMEKDPEKRYQTADELMSALESRVKAVGQRTSWAGNIAVVIIPIALLVPLASVSLFHKNFLFRHDASTIDRFSSPIHKKSMLKSVASWRDFSNQDPENIRHLGGHYVDGGPGLKKDLSKGVTFLRRAYQMAIEQGEPMEAVKCLTDIGDAFLANNDEVQAKANFERALVEAKKAGFSKGESYALTRLADIFVRRRDFNEAISYRKKSIAVCPPDDVDYFLRRRRLADTLVEANRADEAKPILTSTMDEIKKVGGKESDPEFFAAELGILGADITLNKVGDANKRVDAVIASMPQSGSAENIQRCLSLTAMLEVHSQYTAAQKLTNYLLGLPADEVGPKNREKLKSLSDRCEKMAKSQ